MTCMVPMALAGETARWSKPDSWYAKARAREGSTPIRRAVSATMVCISAREGTGEAFSSALFLLAELHHCSRVAEAQEGAGDQRCGGAGRLPELQVAEPVGPGMASLLPG